MLELRREHGAPVLRIGHRGAAYLAPENTLGSLRAAVDHGVDLVEFDVLDLVDGQLVLAHSDRLVEVTHGARTGRVRGRTLDELREVAPDVPTFEEALEFFVDEAPHVGLHVDLKLRGRVDELAATLGRFGVAARTVVSSAHAPTLVAMARHAPEVTIGLTYPEDRFGVGNRRTFRPAVRVGLTSMRLTVPAMLPRLLRRSAAGALMLQHELVTPRSVAVAHRLGVPVLAWTVDAPEHLERVLAAEVDGVVTNDPRIFGTRME